MGLDGPHVDWCEQRGPDSMASLEWLTPVSVDPPRLLDQW